MRVLCCGATGMVGTALLENLRAHTDWQLRGTYRRTPPQHQGDRLEYLPADLTRAQDCQKVAQGCECAVLAAATTAGARHNIEAPDDFVTANLVLNARMLQALAEAGTRRVVLVSTASLYPERAEPWREADLDLNDDPPAPFFGIGWVMRSLEKLARFWHLHKGMEVVIVRLANAYGPWARFDPAHSNFIPALIRKAVNQDDPYCVWGSPHVTRDVLYVDDCARALRLLLEQPDLTWGVFNLASGQSVTVKDVVQGVLQAAGHRPSRVEYQSAAPTTVAGRAYSIAALQQAIPWRPEISLQTGLERTTAWWRTHQATWTR